MEETRPTITELADGKSVALFGCGLSCKAAERLLNVYGVACVYYQESHTNHALVNSGAKEDFTEEDAYNHKLVVYAPAFRPDHPWLIRARKCGVQTICEPDLAALAFDGKIIAITGTDGKTTVTTFLTKALKSQGKDAFEAGNIGLPLSDFCADLKKNSLDTSDKIAVCELSSFQTADLKYLKPSALIWTNFAEDHLDWHRDMREYFFAKLNLVKNLVGDKIFITQKEVVDTAKDFGVALPAFAQILDFAKLSDEDLQNYPSPFNTRVQAQNFEMVKTLWQSLDENVAQLLDVAKSFSLPQFRFGEKQEIDGVEFYNDSKATNVHSAIAALQALSNCKNLIWIGGGKDKYCPLDKLVEQVQASAKGAVLIGQTAQTLKNMLADLPMGCIVCETLEEAVETAFAMCRGKKDAKVLFSPAFSSFGMFSGYVERGKVFNNALLCLKNPK